MRILVCGGRDFMDRAAVALALKDFKPERAIEVGWHIIIHGGCPTGADKLADEWADTFGVRKRVYLADWQKHGKAAGPLRNARMLAEGKPDLVIAFSGGRGTLNCVKQARAAGVRVQLVGWSDD